MFGESTGPVDNVPSDAPQSNFERHFSVSAESLQMHSVILSHQKRTSRAARKCTTDRPLPSIAHKKVAAMPKAFFCGPSK
jgi:hypothetical protein